MSARVITLCSLALLLSMASPTAAQHPAPLGLDVSLPAAKRLAGARDLIAAQDWDAAFAALERLDGDFGASLLEIEPGRYLNVRHAITATLTGLPETGRSAYRRRVDPAMKLLFDEARNRHSPELMRQVVRDGFASSVGDDALDWLAEDAFESGDTDNARRWWTLLLPAPAGSTPQLLLRVPDARLKPADVAARLVLCSLLQGDRVRAEHEVADFAARYGETSGSLAGRDGVLSDHLSALLDESRAWTPASRESFAGSGAIGGAVGRGLDLAAIQWSQPLAPAAPAGSAASERERSAQAAVPFVQPGIWNDVLIVPDTNAVRALSLADGSPRWPTDAGTDDGTVYADLPAAGTLAPNPPFAQNSCQVFDGRCYVRLATPQSALPSTPLARAPSRLVCLDLNAEGRLIWVAGSDEFGEFPDGCFSGSPLVSEGRVYIPVRWGSPQVEVGVACLDAGTGELRWHRQVCTAQESGSSGGQDSVGAGADSAYLLASQELLVACDAVTGALQWATTIAARTSRTASARPGAVVCRGGRVFAKPGDSNQVLAFAAEDGRRLWLFDPPSRVDDLLGIVGGRLIAAGDHLWGIDVATGRGWRFGFDDPEGYGYGRGAIAGGRIYWPTHEELFVVEPQHGLLVDRILLDPAFGLTGGNLTASGDRLTIATAASLFTLGPVPVTQ